ncbi:MAG: hypothetical protein ACTSRP_00030 [Candidatus Helarchaeota archaeon]
MYELIGFMKIFEEIRNFDNFFKFIQKDNNLSNEQLELAKDDLFKGLKLFLTLTWAGLINALNYQNILELTEDKYYMRAFHYELIPIEEIPVTCERTALIKGLWDLFKNARKARNYYELNKALFKVEPFLNDVKKLLNNITYFENIDCSLRDKILTIYTLFNNFHNCQNGYPPVFKNQFYFQKITDNLMIDCFYGFIYILSYLWSKFLSKNELIITNLNTLNIFAKQIKQLIKNFYKLNSKDKLLLINSYTLRIWIELDKFYSKISQFITNNYENIIGLWDAILRKINFKEKPDKKRFIPYMKKIESIEYPPKKNKKYLKKYLDLKFIWYPLDILKGYHFFNGFFLCESLIIGEIMKRKLNNVKEKLLFKIIKHPDGDIGRISFAILIEGYGTSSSDFGGWLIFYDSATYGYSGFGPTLYKKIKILIEQNQNLIDFEEIEINKDIFKEYLKEHHIYRDDNYNQEDKENLIYQLYGKLFEAVIYNIYSKKKNFSTIWDTSINKKQIDILAVNHNKRELDLIECKLNLHLDELNDYRDNLILKKKEIQKKYKNYKINCLLYVFNSVNIERKRQLNLNNIQVIDNVKEIIKKQSEFSREIKKLFEKIEKKQKI